LEDNYRHPVDEKKVKFKPNILGSRRDNSVWILFISFLSFFVSATLLFSSTKILEQVSFVIALFVILGIIIFGIIFDIIGIAVTAADETPFHAMASRKHYAAKQAIMLIRNANKVSSFCNDVVGDICGVISGTAAGFIILRLSGNSNNSETSITGLVIMGLVASITVGGKAMGKTIAIENSNYIVYKVAVITRFFMGKFNFKKIKTKKR
jgi:hypothetical protein